MGLRANPREAGDIVIVDLNGRITLGDGCQSVGELVHELIARNQKKILLNLAEVNFIDSAGIGRRSCSDGYRNRDRAGAGMGEGVAV